jgi:excisionase family DNA binding protein
MSRGLGRALIESLDPEDLAELAVRLIPLIRPQPVQDRPKEWLSSREAAEHLGVSVATVARMVADGRLRARRDHPKGRLYFRRTELEQMCT